MSLRTLFSLSVLAFLAGCSSLPESLNAQSDAVVTDFQQWSSQAQQAEQDVRLGGVIAGITNLKDKTRIELVNMPIDDVGRPNLKDDPAGRYVAYVDGFLDPVAYSAGRLITVVGTSAGVEKGKVGESELTMPVMNVYGHYLWRIEEWVAVDRTESYLSTCHGIHCTTFSMGPSRGRVIQEVK
ncbi:Slp family lipoprotein [Vibrio sp. SCSIO 43136]|uniref:Slp family lipoprotein n=1 Tax=Vibrio sp. SCSIO 43136 TaxID=2819101 RepID=UPI0020762BEA|nr:Slp family lipoprotein [Vibrio sp. SCSIO 43136]USD64523.1 Slp family lipoprotein [Vibrio sp. SCSIO 43136]